MLVLGFVFELPWDTGVPDGFVLPSWREDYAGGDPTRAIRDAIGLGLAPSPRHTLDGWAEFQTVSIPVQLPLAASDMAFGHARSDIGGRRARRKLDRAVHKHTQRFEARRTVSFVNVVVEKIEEGPANGKAFFRALEILNFWLVSLGISFDMRLRPVSVGDLPEVIPCLPTDWHEDGTSVRGIAKQVQVRPAPGHIPTYSENDLVRALDMFSVISTRVGLATFYELVQRAGSSKSNHRYREAVTDYATAGEVFVTEIYGQIAPRLKEADHKIANVVQGPFADRVRHLSRLLGSVEDPTDSESIVFLWWLHCYTQRHAIVHAGRDSLPMLVEAARIGLVTMVVDVRESLRTDSDLSNLASGIRWAYRVDETSEGRDSWPEGDPRAP